MKRDNSFSEWNEVITNSKTKVERFFYKYDIERKTPFIFDGWVRDLKTGDRLITMHTKKEWDNELDTYLSYAMTEEEFNTNFDSVIIEY